MKYMILIHSDMQFWQESLPEAEANRVLGNHYKVIEETKASGGADPGRGGSATSGHSSSSGTARRP